MGASHCAAVALCANVGVPVRNFDSYATFEVFCRAVLPGAIEYAVFLEDGQRQFVAVLTVNRDNEVTNEIRHINFRCRSIDSVSPGSRDFDFRQAFDTSVDSFVVLVNDFLAALLEVGVVVASLHGFDSFVDRNNVRQFEECSLEDGVNAVTKADFTSELRSVDDVELSVFIEQIFLHLCREFFVQFFYAPRTVQEVYTAVFEVRRRIIFLYVCRCMATNEVSGTYEVRSMDRFVTET